MISPGLPEGQIRDARARGRSAAVERARAHDRLTPAGFEAEVERATRVLESIDRRAVLRLQRIR